MPNTVEDREEHYAIPQPVLDWRSVPGRQANDATSFFELRPDVPLAVNLPSSLAFASYILTDNFDPAAVALKYGITWYKQSPRFEIERSDDQVLRPLLERKKALRDRLAEQLLDAREEAREENITILTTAAENECQRFAGRIIEQHFWRGSLRLAATAKLNGGATLVAADQATGRRIDFEFSPGGEAPTVFAMDHGGRVTRARFDEAHKGMDYWLLWLLHRARPSPP